MVVKKATRTAWSFESDRMQPGGCRIDSRPQLLRSRKWQLFCPDCRLEARFRVFRNAKDRLSGSAAGENLGWKMGIGCGILAASAVGMPLAEVPFAGHCFFDKLGSRATIAGLPALTGCG